MKILGIDYGLTKIGIAIATDNLPRPIGVVNNSPKVFKKLREICQKNQIEKIVVGLPEDKIALKVKDFAQLLSRKVGLPVEFQDETLTTSLAIARMIEIGKKKKTRQEEEDAFAAANILQEYLEERRRNV